MQTIGTRRRLIAALVTFGIGATVASTAAIGAVSSADEPSPPPQPTTLVIEDVDGATRVAVLDQHGDDVPGLGPVTIAVDNRCAVTNWPSGLVGLQVRGSGGNALPLHLVQSRLGTRQQGGPCGGNSARVVDAQTLRIEVGETLSGLGYAFDSASLNVGSNQGGGLTYSLDGGPTVATNELVQGRLVIDPPAPFNEVEIGLVGQNGSFGLRSGGGPVDERTELSLVRVGIPIDCNDDLTIDDLGLDTIDEVTFVRFLDKDGECSIAWLRVDVESDVELDPGVGPRDVVTIDPIGDAEQIQARVLVQWSVPRLDSDGEPKPPAQLNDELVRYVQYADGEPVLFVEYCTGVDGLPDDLLDPDPASVGVVDALDDQPWCLLYEDRTLDGDHVVQRMIFFVNGDPKFF